MTMGVLLIVYLLALCLVSMLVMWRSLRGQRRAPTPRPKGRFALQEGQTILGVMDTTETMFFCIGPREEYVHDEEDTVT